MELSQSVSVPNRGGKRFQRRVYGWKSDDEPRESVLEMLPLHLDEYDLDQRKDSLFLETAVEDDEGLVTHDLEEFSKEEDKPFAEHYDDDEDEPLIKDSTQADINVVTKEGSGLDDGVIEKGTTQKESEEEISSRRRSRRVLDKITKQEELMERLGKILTETDTFFHQFTATQRDSITVRDVVQMLEENLKWSLSKDEKKQVRGRLTELNTALTVLQPVDNNKTDDPVDGTHAAVTATTIEEEPEDVDMEPVFDKDDSDYENDLELKTSRKSNSARKRVKKTISSSTSKDSETRIRKKSKLNPKDFALDRDSQQNESTEETRHTKPKRKPAHLKIHLDMKKKREAKIREEENALKNQQNEKVNEQDRILAQLIARKFETDNEELRIQRTEDRLNLLEKLERRRWGVLHSSCEIDGLDEPLSSLHDSKSSDEIAPTTESYQDKDTVMQEVNASTDDDDSEDSDEEELEIIHSNASAPIIKDKVTTSTSASSVPIKQISPTSILDIFGLQKQVRIKKPTEVRHKVNTVVSRTALIKILRVKQFQAGNEWLARELEYEKPEDHIRQCMYVMKEKRKQILQKEEGRRCALAERKVWMQQQVLEEEDNHLDSQDDLQLKRSMLSDGNNLDTIDDENIDDDEQALARKLEREKEMTNDDDQDELSDYSESHGDNTSIEEVIYPGNDETLLPDSTQTLLDSDELVRDYTQDGLQSVSEDLIEDNTQRISQQSNPFPQNIRKNENNAPTETETPTNRLKDEEEHEFDEQDVLSREMKSTVKKNAAWKAMLLKEAEHARKQKKMRAIRDGLVEAEAEEEEEEEGIAGLEDFGFTIGAKKKSDDDEEDNDEIMDEDMDNVVDELSDDEGDEEAGEKARKALEAKEEMERLKEIKRRVREGYDGRREGIAGGISNARGVHRFDQLVAADNLGEAKRLGLQNDDESDDESNNGGESKGGDGEIDDEAALLDKALKERYMKTFDLPETFSDEEGDEAAAKEDEDGGTENSENEDDREQERLAKRFAKRARMNRLLEIYNGDSQFSRSRLLDEDMTLRKDLKALKNAHSKTSRNISVGSLFSSVMSSQASLKRSASQSTRSTESQRLSTSTNGGMKTATGGNKLSLSLRICSNSDRCKTSFLGRAKVVNSVSRSSSYSK